MAPEPAGTDGPAPYWKCVVAAAPQLLLSLQFLLAQRDILPFGLVPDDLTGAMASEVVVLYAAFVIGFVWFFVPEGRFWRWVRNWNIAMFLIGLAAAAFSLGTAVAVQSLALGLVTYFGLLMSWRDPAALLQLSARFAVAMAAMAIASGTFSTADQVLQWKGDPRVLSAGCLYFFLLGAVELSGLYLQTIPRNRAMIMAKLRELSAKFMA